MCHNNVRCEQTEETGYRIYRNSLCYLCAFSNKSTTVLKLKVKKKKAYHNGIASPTATHHMPSPQREQAAGSPELSPRPPVHLQQLNINQRMTVWFCCTKQMLRVEAAARYSPKGEIQKQPGRTLKNTRFLRGTTTP